jgi:UDP-N-acetylmuramoyl-tripeptide--D-alanyl-D-alanine ligase
MNNIDNLYLHYRKNPSVSTDSRNIRPGDIFFALRGENFNGNLFAADAIDKGASLAVVDEPVSQDIKKFLRVGNVLKCLQQLAIKHRNTLKTRFIGITGSNGKTTTKELIHAVLSSAHSSQATKGNLNNHIGVPMTLLSIKSDTEFAIIEMGANHEGEIAQLCKMAKPQYGLITNIGKAHLEGFGSIEGVIRAKSELYDFLRKNNGLAFLNKDNPILAGQAKGMNSFTYGTGEDVDIHVELQSQKPFLQLRWKQPEAWLMVDTQLYGTYNIENTAAAIAVGQYFNISPNDIVNTISRYIPENNRSQVMKTIRNNTLILDAYNANPTSMELALRNFSALTFQRKYVIIGDMYEVGITSQEEHQALLDLIKDLDFKHVMLVGKLLFSMDVPAGWLKFNDVEDAKKWIRFNKITNHTILIKGSRKVGLEKITEML